jgi:hypothetical protein
MFAPPRSVPDPEVAAEHMTVTHGFSPEEDEQLTKLVEKWGCQRWSLISHHMQPKTAKQCRERWYYALDPGLNRGVWTKEEDRILIEKHRELGNSWTKIARFLPGRTDSLVKSRWSTHLRGGITHDAHPTTRVVWQPISVMDFGTIPAFVRREQSGR